MIQHRRDTRELIAEFIERNHISSVSEIVDNNSKIYKGYCHKTVLKNKSRQATVYSFSNPLSHLSHTLVSDLWFVASNADHGGYLESYERWHQEYDYSDQLNKAEERAWYEYSRQCYCKLLTFLGEELYQELARIERGEA